MSLPNNLIMNPVGVTTKKNIIPMTNGDTIFPKNNPNLNQSLFNGDKILEFNKPKIKKIIAIIKDHFLKSPLLINGKSPIIKNTVQNTTPKFRLEPILISSLIILLLI